MINDELHLISWHVGFHDRNYILWNDCGECATVTCALR